MSSHNVSEVKAGTNKTQRNRRRGGFKIKQGTDIDHVAFRNILNKCTPDENARRLISAASTNDMSTLYQLLQADINPNSIDKLHRTALHYAVLKGNVDIVKVLIQFGANVNAEDIVGNTPLHLVTNRDIMQQLLNAGADESAVGVPERRGLVAAHSKLQTVKHDWHSGIIQMIQLHNQLQKIVDRASRQSTMQDARMDTVAKYHNAKLIDLEKLELSYTSGRDEEVDDQMSNVVNELEEFSLK